MSERRAHRSVDVAVIGGGIIGLGIAWAVAQTGRTAVVIDPDPAGGATFAAAGMLAAVSELHYQEEALLELMLASSALYPAFIESLGTASDLTGYQRTRTINVGAEAADRQALADLRGVQLVNGLGVEPLTVREARELEPLLSPRISGAFLVGQDHQVDPRQLTARIQLALVGLVRDGQPAVLRVRARGLLHDVAADASSRVTGVALVDGSTVSATEVVVANGLGAADLSGLPEHLRLPLRPVYGEVLRLRVPEHLRPLLTCTVRGLVHGVPVYLVPRTDGTLVIGATQREDGSSAVSAGGVHQLLRDAQELVPAVSELELLEVTARARPGTPDNAPLLGRVSRSGADSGDIPGLIIATGFFRHGVLLTPMAAQHCVDLIEGNATDRWRSFRPDRFSASRVLASASLNGGHS
ncbi:glycine oxidase ThiO [Cryobacterium sp. TMT1-3]|uniref:glycine oxidase n=1 Tax=Cryobacterium luteum TaxID=1424661 RepID=A0A1H8AKF9_9MICO|nr:MULTISPECIES: glycine oxidase ThiO [Cryobacterium]TFB88548.1 glycine oxidase ThiO [Cryobacterium luteum]TFC24575.1 glycine oxidase ThiO [Cryobacterium sp. TMT1-3]SEM71003.1 glycine oxidase [Cryobacterium luteum]